MEHKTFKFKGTYHCGEKPPNTCPCGEKPPYGISDLVLGDVQATDIMEALRIVGEGRTTPPHRFYMALVYGQLEGGKTIHGRYLSAKAAQDEKLSLTRQYLEHKLDGLLFDIDEAQENPRIDLRKQNVWVPLKELTEGGWVQLEERV